MNKFLGILFALVFLTVAAPANMLTNPGFETPGDTTNYTDSGWTSFGTTTRRILYPRGGSIGGVIEGWNTTSSAGVHQVVSATAGTYTFSIWVRPERNYLCTANRLKIGWYDANTNPIQEETTASYTHGSDELWHQMHVTGTCES